MSIRNLLLHEAKGYLEKGSKQLQKKGKHYMHPYADNTAAIIIAAATGLTVGIILGILFAPDRGSETRSNIANSVKEFGQTVSDKTKQGREALSNIADKTTEAIGSKVAPENGKSNSTPPAS